MNKYDLFGIFIVLHGLVHLLYVGQSSRKFELQPNMIWPDESWVLSRFMPIYRLRILTNILLIIAAIGFVLGAINQFIFWFWLRPFVVFAAITSSITYLITWDGKFKHLDHQGFVGILINIAIVIAAYFFYSPPSS